MKHFSFVEYIERVVRYCEYISFISCDFVFSSLNYILLIKCNVFSHESVYVFEFDVYYSLDNAIKKIVEFQKQIELFIGHIEYQ